MATLRGVAVVTGAVGVVFTAGIVSATNKSSNQSVGFVRDADHVMLKNASGDSVADFITNRKRTLTATLVPFHLTTLTGARASASAYRLAPGTLITITDTDSGIASGDYLLVSSKEKRTNDGFVTIDVEITNRDDNNVTTTPA